MDLEPLQPFDMFTDAFQPFYASADEVKDTSRQIELKLALINSHFQNLQKEANSAIGKINAVVGSPKSEYAAKDASQKETDAQSSSSSKQTKNKFDFDL